MIQGATVHDSRQKITIGDKCHPKWPRCDFPSAPTQILSSSEPIMRARCLASCFETRCHLCRRCGTSSARMQIQTTSCSLGTFPVTSPSIKFVATLDSLESLRMCRLRSDMVDQVRPHQQLPTSFDFNPCAFFCFVLRSPMPNTVILLHPLLASIRNRHCANYVRHKRIRPEGCGGIQRSAGAEQRSGLRT